MFSLQAGRGAAGRGWRGRTHLRGKDEAAAGQTADPAQGMRGPHQTGARGSGSQTDMEAERPHGAHRLYTGTCEPFLRCIWDVEDVTTALPALTRVHGRRFPLQRPADRHESARAPWIACHNRFPPALISVTASLRRRATTAHNSATWPPQTAPRWRGRTDARRCWPPQDPENRPTLPALSREDERVRALRIHRGEGAEPHLHSWAKQPIPTRQTGRSSQRWRNTSEVSLVSGPFCVYSHPAAIPPMTAKRRQTLRRSRSWHRRRRAHTAGHPLTNHPWQGVAQ